VQREKKDQNNPSLVDKNFGKRML